MAKTLNARIITKHDTEANWKKAVSFIPKQGEIIVYEAEYSEDNLAVQVPRIKVGNGIDTINTLPFINDPYVLKDGEKKLSTHDYTTHDKTKVDRIPDNWIYKDTTYTPGIGLSLTNTTFWNSGIVDIIPIKGGFKTIKYSDAQGEVTKGDDFYFSLTSEVEKNIFSSLQNYIKTGDDNGTIKVNNSSIPIKGWDSLGDLAFKNMSDINLDASGGVSSPEVEITLLNQQASLPPNIKLWYNENLKNLFYNSKENGFLPILPNNIVTSVLQSEVDGYITVINSRGEPSEIPIGTSIDFISQGQQGAYFKVKYSEDEEETIYTNGLSLSGGTLTNDLIVSNMTKAQYRAVYGDYGFMIRNDGSSTYFLLTNKGDAFGTWNSLRPLTINNATGDISCSKVYGAVWNDYAEYRQSKEYIEPGYIVYSGDDGILHKTKNRLQHFEGVVSDTFGFAIGETDKAKTPLAVAGRVLVYTDEELHAGDVVCAGENGKASKMDNIEIANKPDRIVGIVSEIPTYETWGEDNIPVNGRVWIRVK